MGEDEGKDSRMRVVVRIRPMNTRELAKEDPPIVCQLDEKALVFDPANGEEDEEFQRGFKKVAKLAQKKTRQYRRKKDATYCFDAVFGPDATQEDVYTQSTSDTVETILDGYNCTVFAYGATGAGKTHTMLGRPDNPGVIARTISSLFEEVGELRKQNTDIKYTVTVNYLEVYNEKINDLLIESQGKNGKDLPMREVGGEIRIARLSEKTPKDPEEIMTWLNEGNSRRTQHPTDANAQSSRSHAVFVVKLKKQEGAKIINSKLTLVDLAGSERATATTNRGARLREGGNINKSLLALGNVINALADPKHKGHINYRDSKLTRILKDGLGGTCRTIMIANVSPAAEVYEDTLNTIKYADSAKNIRSNLQKRVQERAMHVGQYQEVIQALKAENARLKNQLSQSKTQSRPEKRPAQESTDTLWETTINRQAEVMRLVGEEKVTLLQKFLKQSKLNVKEVLEKEQKKDCEDEEDHGPGTNRDIRVLASLDAKINRIKEKKEGLEKQIESTRPSSPPNSTMKWRLAAEELREKSLIQENLLTLFYEDLKSTEKMLLSIANSIHNPELIPDILNPTKLSVNFNEENENDQTQGLPVFLNIEGKSFEDFVAIKPKSSFRPKASRALNMTSALKTKPKSSRPLLSKSRSDSSLRKKSPGPSISSFGRPKSASKATEDRPKRVLKENRVPQEGLKNSVAKRKSDETPGETFREERTDTQAAPSKRAKLAIEKPVPSYMRATATTARKNDLVELRRLKQQATSQDTLDRLKNLREKLRKNK